MQTVPALYDAIRAEENRVPAKDQISAGTKILQDKLAELGATYDQFVYQLQG
jgi:hypothetical protein